MSSGPVGRAEVELELKLSPRIQRDLERLAKIVDDSLSRGSRSAGESIERNISRALESVGRSISSAFEGIEPPSFEEVLVAFEAGNQLANDLRAQLDGITEAFAGIAEAGERANDPLASIAESFDQLTQRNQQLAQIAEAFDGIAEAGERVRTPLSAIEVLQPFENKAQQIAAISQAFGNLDESAQRSLNTLSTMSRLQPFENKAQQLAAISQAFGPVNREAARALDAFAEMRDVSTFERLIQSADAFVQTLAPVSQVLDNIANQGFAAVATAAKVAGVAIAGLAATAVFTGAEYNKLQATVRGALNVIVDGQDKAAQGAENLLDAVNALNDESPFARSAFLQLTQTLAGFGVEAEKIPDVLDGIQQAVAATGGQESDLLSLGSAFAKIASSGKLTGDIIQSFATRGIDVVQLLAKEFNVTGEELRKSISDGAVDATKAIEALTTILRRDFGGATENVRNTFVGASDRIRASLRNIGGDITSFFINPMGAVDGSAGAGVDAMNSFADSLGNIRAALKPLIEQFIPPLAAGLLKIANFFEDLTSKLVKSVPVVDQFGNALSKAGEPVTTLVAKAEPLTSLLNDLSGFLPIVVALVAKFGTAFLSQIPIVGQFLTGLDPITAAILTLIAVLPPVREAFLAVGAILLPIVAELLPKLSALLNTLGDSLGPAVGDAVLAIGIAMAGLLESLNFIVPLISNFVDFLSPLSPIITGLIIGFVALGVAVKAYAAAQVISNVVTKAATVAKIALTAITQGTTAALLLNTGAIKANTAALLANPWVLAAAAIVALGVAIFAAYRRFETFRNTVDRVIDIVGGALSAAFNVVRTAISGLMTALSAIGAAFQAIFNFIRPILPVLAAIAAISLAPLVVAVSALVVAFRLGPEIVGFFVERIKDLVGAIAGVGRAIAALISGGFEILRVVGTSVWGVIEGAVEGVVGAIAGVGRAIASLISGFTDVARVVGGAVVNALNSVIKKFTEFGPAKFIIDGIKEGFEAAAGVIRGLTDQVGKLGGVLSKVPGLGRLFKDTKDEADAAGIKIKELDNVVKNISGLPVKSLADRLKDLKDAAAAATDALQTQLGEATATFDPVLSAAEKLQSAQAGVARAQEAASAAGQRIRDLEKERARVLRETISPAKEVAAAERELAKARSRVGDIDRQIIATQKELDRLRGVETLEEEAANERDIERAKIALNQARRQEQELLAATTAEKEKGNQETVAEVSLAGLTLQQARNKLAAVRATLEAQRAGQKTTQDDTKQAKTQEEIDEERRLKRLDVLDAEQRVKDTERDAINFKIETQAKVEEGERKLNELQFERNEALDAQNESQEKLNRLRDGETTRARELKRIDDQITSAKNEQKRAAEGVAAASRAALQAETLLAIESAKVTGNIARAAELQAKLLKDRAAGLPLEDAVRAKFNETTTAIQNQINKVNELNSKINAVNAIQVSGQFTLSQQAGGISGPLNQNIDKLTVAIDTLATALGDDAALRQQAYLANKGVNVPLKIAQGAYIGTPGEGGLARGHNNGRGVFATIAEYGAEAVLPLTRPGRMKTLLQDGRILNPVLNALPRITLPQPTARPTTLLSGVVAPPTSLNLGSGGTGLQARSERRREQRELAKAIAEELAAAGFEGGNVTVQAPITVAGAYNEELVARRIEDRIMKAIERRLR